MASPVKFRPLSARRAQEYIAVVAIDFGTTYSGFAFSFIKSAYTDRDIYMNKEWGHDHGLSTLKAPTCILLTPEREFDSFGYQAQEKYASLEDAQDTTFLFFDRFKMELHSEKNEEVGGSLKLKARNGQLMDAIDIFAFAINFLKEKALDVIKDRAGIEITSADIRWVLTVPAIWRHVSKQFMREAAYKADLVPESKENQLIIALEPEAASLHCRQRKMREFVEEEKNEACCADVIAKPKTSYMVVDCGGGTVDVTVHRINDDDSVEEIHKATGGAWGGTQVDKQFESLLVKVFGGEFIEDFKSKHPSDWLEINIDLEGKKRSDRPLQKENNTTRIRLPSNFIYFYCTHHRQKTKSIQDLIKEQYTKSDVKINRDFLCIGAEVMKNMFKEAIYSIVSHISMLLEMPTIKCVQYIFLVGGFSESPLLQLAVRKKFENRARILIPENAGLSVMKGAVMFGLKPDVIRRRICRETHGCGTCAKFNPAIHNEKYMFKTSNGDIMCNNLFTKLVTVNEEVRLGEIRNFTFCPVETSQSKVAFEFYTTSKSNVMYVNDPGVYKEGTKIVVDSPNITKGLGRDIEIRLEFGGTEIKVEARDVETGDVKPATLKLSTTNRSP
ncbi:heat shock 70 kDa protein 12A-like isoform X2 [Saccoglossus kowalevskii]|uniref:Heat shock 70 kDa protein 12A-like n=1 Tax=Saccoglossus kowalevskii TaxID=10224 RepID=A0ABM0MU91_SACKO|nr:PREDICTED: heat shock 70 kDa protein 12A-like [Saccoglossus kowalevskii]